MEYNHLCNMKPSSYLLNIEISSLYISVGNLLLTSLFDIAWIIHCMRECWRVAMEYRICKQTPDLHPIYRDVQYLSRQRKLYNLKTHFVKYVLIIMCLSVEICTIIWTFAFLVSSFEPLNLQMRNEWIHIQSKYPHCHSSDQVAHLVLSPIYIIMYTLAFFHYIFLNFLLSVLTRYLAARYLNHSFKRTLLKYALWLAVQSVLVLICSSIYTIPLSLLLFPLLISINWIALIRDTRILSRVLRSNLREIQYHTNNKILYRAQLSAYRFYIIFQKTLLFSIFLQVVLVMLNSIYIFLTIGTSICLVNLVLGTNYTLLNTIKIPEAVNSTLVSSEYIIGDSFTVLYSLSSSLPIICVSLIPLIRACVTRYKSRHIAYRYNYESFK